MLQLDHHATTKPTPEVVVAVLEALTDAWANPSSVHRDGQRARQLIELARGRVAALIGARPRQITFTGTGTEAIDLAIRGTLDATPRAVLVTTEIEHAAIGELVDDLKKRGEVEVRHLPLLEHGVVDERAIDEVIDDSVGMVSVQWANNETGVVQDLARIGARAKAVGAVFHSDATQWVGKMPTDAMGCGADVLTFSPHKFHGPKGVGVLWARPGVGLRPRVRGSQELGRRGGTENVPAIAGAGVAAEQARAWLEVERSRRQMGEARDRFERAVLKAVPGAVVNRPGVAARLWSVSNIAFVGLEAEAILLGLSERGVAASAGAACSSGSLEPSPVLLAMGLGEARAHGSVRFSVARDTPEQSLQDAVPIVAEVVRSLGGVLPTG